MKNTIFYNQKINTEQQYEKTISQKNRLEKKVIVNINQLLNRVKLNKKKENKKKLALLTLATCIIGLTSLLFI